MTIEVRCGMGWMPDGRPGDLRPATVEEYVAEIERLRSYQEGIAKAVEQSAFCYSGTCATRLVPSASGEAATHVVAAYIRSLDLSAAPAQDHKGNGPCVSEQFQNHALSEQNEKLRAAMAWVGEVMPGKNRETGGAVVHMTWAEFNAMREVLGLPPKPVPRGAR